jgi:hypothetical protein
MTAETLETVRLRVEAFLKSRQTPGRPFGHFNQCAHAYADDELSALCVALELWKMLGLPLSREDLDYAIARMVAMQDSESGLVTDPTWDGRKQPEPIEGVGTGDSFFTRSAMCAVRAWGKQLPVPVSYLARETSDSLLRKVLWQRGGHHPWSIGDLAVLLLHNRELEVPGADELHAAVCAETLRRQDPTTGLWPAGEEALTPSINLSFHTIKFTINVMNKPLQHAEKIIDSCLAACRDPRFYSWENGYACNDLDIAHVLYCASRWSSHRKKEIGQWAREQIPVILSIQKPDGGFSFYHERAMDHHYLLQVSPSEQEGDLWGTLMYMGTLLMMVKLGFPELPVPWITSEVHKVPVGPS